MAGTYPAQQVDFAPGVAANVVPGGGDWVDITDKVFEWGTKWGAEDEFTQPGAGTADLLLDNSDGDFDPDNSSGPYFGDLLPGVWVRIRIGATSLDWDAFYGHVTDDGFQVGASQYPDSIVGVRLTDDADSLANAELPNSLLEVEVLEDSPAIWWRLGESSGTQATDASGNARHGTYAGDATENSVGAITKNNDTAAIGFDGVDDAVYFSPWAPGNAWSIEFWIQAEAQAGSPAVVCLLGGGSPNTGAITISEKSSSSPKLQYSYTDPSTGNYTEYESTADVFDGEPHHVVITQSGATANLYVDAIQGKTLTDGSAANITWGPMEVAVGSDDHSPLSRHVAGAGAFLAATLDEVLLYTSALSAVRVATHWFVGANEWQGLTSDRVSSILDYADYPASHRNINTGRSTMGRANLGQSAWDALVEVAKAEGGAVYIDHQDAGKFRFLDRRHRWENATSVTSVATIGDSGAEIPAAAIDLVDDRIINVATAHRDGGAPVTVDESAGSAYGRRSISETGLLYDSDAESQARAERWVAEKKDRHRRVRSFTLSPRKSTHPAWAVAVGLRLNNRVTVKWRPTYGGTRSYEAWVIGIAHRWRRGGGFDATFWCAPVPFDTTGDPYWILGTSTAGVTTRPGY